jgi:tetratricopeptide (TPR) repeat protein
VVTEVPAADASEADLLLQAQQAHGNSQFADEAMLLQKVAEHARSWQAVCPEIGKAYERAGAMDSAIKSFDHCAALAPNDVDTLLAFAHTLVAKPDYARASALYRRCIQTDPQNLDAKTGLALIDLRENRLREADQTARLVLSKAPNNTDALLITGIVAWRESRLTDAEQIFSKGAAIDDRRADFHAFLGRIAEAQLRPQVALQQYEKALALDPGDSEISDRRDRLRAGK